MDAAAQNMIETAWLIAPELGIMAAATFLVLLGCLLPAATAAQRRTAGTVSVAVAALAFAGALLLLLKWSGMPATKETTAVPFVFDGLSRVLRPFSMLAGLALLLLFRQRLNDRYPAEQLACLMFIIAGVSLVTAVNDLTAMFVSLELISIPTYVLLYLSRPKSRDLEATVKYFLLSIFSSGFVLYGMSFLLGAAGSTNFAIIRQSLHEPTGMVSVGMLQIACVLIVAGLGFRIASVPFHFYAPDVFQGTSMPAAALLAVVPKIAGFVALLRLVWSVLLTSELHADFAALGHYGPAILAGLAVLTMTVGNVLALLQTDLRRLLAYSSVAHAGYMLVGLAVPPSVHSPSGPQAVIFYLLVYSTLTFGAFAVLVMLKKQDHNVETIRDLNGLGASAPLAAGLLAVFLFGLTGLPPTAGFWGKFNLFMAAWSTGTRVMQMLAIALAVNAAIAAWYYLRLIKSAFLDAPAESTAVVSGGQIAALYGTVTVCASSVVALFFFPNALWSLLHNLT